MSKYTTQAISGFNATPPSDNGSQVESNKVKWSFHIDKIGTPCKNLAEAINTSLISHFNIGPDTVASAYTVVTSDYGKTLEVTGTTTITLGTLAALGAGFIVTIKNAGAGVVTIDGAGSETIQGLLTLTLDINESSLLQIDAGASDWMVISNSIIVTAGDIGLGVTDAVTFDTLNLTHNLEIVKTASEISDHAASIDCDIGTFTDVMALDINYNVNTLPALVDASSININIDKSSSVGGRAIGISVNANDGAAEVIGARYGIGVQPISQNSGTFVNPTFASNNTTATDVSTMRDGIPGNTNAIMVADNDYIIIGNSSSFSQLDINLATNSSKSIQAEFFYSIAGTNQFTEFFPVDGSEGMQHNGTIIWDVSTFVAHVADTVTGTFNIKIVRTRNGSITNPVLGFAKSGAVTDYGWNENGNLTVNNVISSGAIIQLLPLTAGTTTTYTVTMGVTSYVTGAVYKARMHATNTGTTTLNIDSLGAINVIFTFGTQDRNVIANQIVLNHISEFFYNGSQFILLNPKPASSSKIITLNATSGTITLNSSFNTIYYVLQENIITLSANIIVDSVSSPTNVLFLDTLDFPNARVFEFPVHHSSLSPLPDNNLIGQITGTTIFFREDADQSNIAASIVAGSRLRFSVTYEILL